MEALVTFKALQQYLTSLDWDRQPIDIVDGAFGEHVLDLIRLGMCRCTSDQIATDQLQSLLQLLSILMCRFPDVDVRDTASHYHRLINEFPQHDVQRIFLDIKDRN